MQCTCGETSRWADTVWGGEQLREKAWEPHRAAHGPPAWETVNPRVLWGRGTDEARDPAGEGPGPRATPEPEARAEAAQPEGLRRAARLQGKLPAWEAPEVTGAQWQGSGTLNKQKPTPGSNREAHPAWVSLQDPRALPLGLSPSLPTSERPRAGAPYR